MTWLLDSNLERFTMFYFGLPFVYNSRRRVISDAIKSCFGCLASDDVIYSGLR